jgi:hypothetical protein
VGANVTKNSQLPWYLGAAIGLVVAFAEASRVPLYLLIAGGLVGGVASAVAWFALGGLFWMPNFDLLRNRGMFVDDNGWAMGLFFVPFAIGAAFVISTLIAVVVVRSTGHAQLASIGANLVPGLLLTLHGAIGALRRGSWDYPGFEVATLLIGLGWGAGLYALIEG